MKLTYPFEFDELILSDAVLDKLGFTEYWGGSGEFGERRLDLGGDGALYEIKETDPLDDGNFGYGDEEVYSPSRFMSTDFQKTLYFLHDMYEDIVSRRTKQEVEAFIEKVKSVNMFPQLRSYLNYKAKNL